MGGSGGSIRPLFLANTFVKIQQKCSQLDEILSNLIEITTSVKMFRNSCSSRIGTAKDTYFKENNAFGY